MKRNGVILDMEATYVVKLTRRVGSVILVTTHHMNHLAMGKLLSDI